MADRVTNFLGDTPLRTAVKLAVISLVVGVIMASLNFTPLDLWYALRDFLSWLYDLGYEAFERLGIYFIYGAMVVVPVFIAMRLLSSGKRS